jgi:cyclophilin family peptidyl-prolyl cis-trans isomerase
MPRIPSMRATATTCAVAIAALELAACGGGDGASPTTVSLPAGCQQAQKPPPRRVELKRPGGEVEAGRTAVATVETTCGRFRIALDAGDSPRTVGSFVYLARRGVYDDTTFHGIDPSFVIQGGDPLGTGKGGPGYFVDEPPPGDTEYTRGTVAMAKTAAEPPGRSGSQFFVVVAADAGLPPEYAVLGEVTEGQRVVQRIASAGNPSSDSGTPLATVVIRRITVAEG